MKTSIWLATVTTLLSLLALLVPGSLALAAPHDELANPVGAGQTADYYMKTPAASSEQTSPPLSTEPVSYGDLEQFLPYPPYGWEWYEPYGGTYYEYDGDQSWTEVTTDYVNEVTDESVSVRIWDTAYNKDFSWLEELNDLVQTAVDEGYGWPTSVAGYPAFELEIYEFVDSGAPMALYSNNLIVLLEDRFLVAIAAWTSDSLFLFSEQIDYYGIAALAYRAEPTPTPTSTPTSILPTPSPAPPPPYDDWPIGVGVLAFVLCAVFFGTRAFASWSRRKRLEKEQLDAENVRTRARIEKEKAEIIDMIEKAIEDKGEGKS